MGKANFSHLESQYYYYYYVSYSYYFSTLHPKVEAVASIFVYFILAGTEDYLRVAGEKRNSININRI